MKKLVLAALFIGGLSQAAGCIITTEEDDTGHFDLTWSLVPDCGIASTASVHSLHSNGQEFIDVYDCIDGGGLTAPLPFGNYTVWVDFLDASNNTIAQSFSQTATIDLGGEHVALSFTSIPRDQGFFAATWTINDGTNDLACADVGAGGVSILSTLVGSGGTGFDDIFDCSAGTGTTAGLDIGDYVVVVSLLETGTDANLGSSMPRNASLLWGNQLEDLGNFEFVVAP